jgi:predicted TIM-barrel fold metal-dependent hydrolase
MSQMRIFDADGHIWEDGAGISRFLPAMYLEDGPLSVDRLFPPIDHLHFHPGRKPPGSFKKVGFDEWLEFMDVLGIEQAAIFPSIALSFGRIPYRNWAVPVSRAFNDWLHETYLSRTPRLLALGLLPLQEPDAAADELERVVTELGMRGGLLPSNGLKGHLASKEYWPVYERADKLGCALAVHGGNHGGLGLDYMDAFAPVHALGHPMGLMICLSGMLFNGIFERYPRVRIGFLEGGVSWLFTLLERFDRSYSTQTPYNPTGELLTLPEGLTIRDYLIGLMAEGRVAIGCEGSEPELEYACKVAGSQAFLYSSDFPHEVTPEACREEIEELLENDDLTEADKQAILHTNSERFYKVNAAC